VTQTNSHDPFNVTDWAALQRRYLETLQAMGGSGPASGTDGTNPWQDALDFWWQRASATLPDEQRGLFTQIVRQARGFLACADFFGPLIEALSRTAAGGADRESEVRSQMDALRQKLAAGAMAPGMEAMLGSWKVPEDFWEQTRAVLVRLPGEWPQMYGAVPMPGKAAGEVESMREGARLWQEYQQALAEYLRMLSGAAHVALGRLQQRLLGGENAGSLRSLYDLWVDCGEEAYSELMSGGDFAACFCRLVNSLSAFRLHARRMIDAGLDALGVPTGRALDSVQRRAAEMRGELRAARVRQQQDLELLRQLQQELAALRRIVQPDAGPDGD
jgi:class III poly(R)-hydroxyalkanoic acid synthase PhaE subunit